MTKTLKKPTKKELLLNKVRNVTLKFIEGSESTVHTLIKYDKKTTSSSVFAYHRSPFSNCQILTIGYFAAVLSAIGVDCTTADGKLHPILFDKKKHGQYINDLFCFFQGIKNQTQIDVSAKFIGLVEKIIPKAAITFKVKYKNTTGNLMVQYLINNKEVINAYNKILKK